MAHEASPRLARRVGMRQVAPPPPRLDREAREQLLARVGSLHMRQRQGIQRDHVTQIFGRGRNFFHIENW